MNPKRPQLLSSVMLRIIILSALLSSALTGQEKSTPLYNEKAFNALTAQQRELFQQHKTKAASEFTKKKYFSCILKTIEAEQIFNKDYELYFWRGLSYSQWDDFDDALANFEYILKSHPRSVAVNRNIFGLHFRAKNHEKSVIFSNRLRALYRTKGFPVQQVPMLEFKRLISLHHLFSKTQNLTIKDEIDQLTSRYPFSNKTPYAYYAKALQLYLNGEQDLADEKIYEATKIFGKPALVAWGRALSDAGIIEQFRNQRLFFYHGVNVPKSSFILVE